LGSSRTTPVHRYPNVRSSELSPQSGQTVFGPLRLVCAHYGHRRATFASPKADLTFGSKMTAAGGKQPFAGAPLINLVGAGGASFHAQFVENSLSLSNVCGIKALGKSAIDRSKQVSGLLLLAPLDP
jgi:hypothetical protein